MRPFDLELVVPSRVGALVVGLALVALASGGCSSPLLTSDVHLTATPRPSALDMGALACQPVATFTVVTSASSQGLSPTVSYALTSVLASASPPIRAVPMLQMLNRLIDHGLAGEYADMLSGFVRGGVFDRDRLRRIGAAIGSRYAMLPGLAEFNQSLNDKFEFEGIKLVRTRVSTLRLWLQLWDTETGHLQWESTGELTMASHIARSQTRVSLDDIARTLWSRMIEEDLIGEANKAWRCP